MRDNQQSQNRGQRGNQRQKATKGTFRLGSAIIEGRIVKDGPVKRYSQQGTPWTEATLLVGLYDSRQKLERDTPAFIRVKAFKELADVLNDFQNKDRVHVAGLLLIDVWEGRDGNMRESYELHADAIDRKPFPKIGKLIADQDTTPAPEQHTDPGYDQSRVDEAADYRNEPPLDNEEQPAPDDDLGEPWRAATPEKTDLTEDDIPF